ncbi:hypothetical protein [Mucilaginibacter sp. NFX135]|uniref:hypothetical protein n=1 Tax=Mucilaginibacter sp. NFX135 TaxID=3402687 RepID=UPI003AFA6A5F
MAEKFLLQGNVKWSYDHELAGISRSKKILAGLVTSTPVLLSHNGYIALTTAELIIEGIEGDEDLIIPLDNIKQVYLGFDDLFPVTAEKSLGMLWQPLRIEYYFSATETQYLYLIIDYNGIYTHDKAWFNTLTEILQ